MRARRAGIKAVGLTAVLALVAACTPLVQEAAAEGLRTATSCGELAEAVAAGAGSQGRTRLFGGEVAVEDRATSEAAPAPSTTVARGDATSASDGDQAAAGAVGGATWGGTNLQEAAVDEADLVKTDGDRLLTVVDGSLRALRLVDGVPSPVGELALDGVAELGWGGASLLVDGDTALVLASSSRPDGTSTTAVTTVDVGELSAPAVRSTIELDGHLVDARLFEGVARVVTSSGSHGAPMPMPRPAQPRPTDDLGSDGPAPDAAAPGDLEPDDELESATYRVLDADGEVVAEAPMYDCAEVYLPPEPQGSSMVHVSSVALGGEAPDGEPGAELLGTASVLGAGEVVYATTDAVYVTTPSWDQGTGAPSVGVHRFDAPPGEPAAYEASGTVEGTLLDQFALSEHDGHLRVATTIPASLPTEQSRSAVVVLRPADGALVEVGRVDGLGPGEAVRAVRFTGDVGYVVTFRQTDPLYTLDLAEPTAPAEVGELKILGYSAYLHPIGDGRLLGVGQDATAEGRILGLQVSLFDVSDPAAPAELDKAVLRGGSSEVEHDHHAFTWWAEGDRAFVPVVSHARGFAGQAEGWPSSALVAFDVAGAEVATGPSLAHPESYDRTRPRSCGPAELCLAAPPAQIRRSLLVDGTLLTISDAGVLASDPSSLAEVAWAPFG